MYVNTSHSNDLQVNRWFINARKVPRQSQSVTRKRKTLKSANKKDKSSLNDNELEVEPLPSCSKVHNLPTRNGDSPIHVRQGIFSTVSYISKITFNNGFSFC